MSPDSELTRIVSEHEPRVRSFFRRRVRNAHDAEDLAQEAMCAVIDAYPRFRGDSNVTTWVYAICSNQLFNHYRGRDRRQRLSVRLRSNGADAAEAAEDRRIRLLALDVAAERLPGHMHRLFTMHYREGRSVREIAEDTDTPEGTVKYHLYILRAQLRRILG
jgi:RNA polymerase sigma-70 factor (ECF subfamily)